MARAVGPQLNCRTVTTRPSSECGGIRVSTNGQDEEETAVQTKETVRDLLDRLPDDCTLDDVLYHLYVIQSIDRGLEDVEAGRTISHEQVAEELRRKWLLGAAG